MPLGRACGEIQPFLVSVPMMRFGGRQARHTRMPSIAAAYREEATTRWLAGTYWGEMNFK